MRLGVATLGFSLLLPELKVLKITERSSANKAILGRAGRDGSVLRKAMHVPGF